MNILARSWASAHHTGSVLASRSVLVFFVMDCLLEHTHAQDLSNPSFEGTPQANIPPPGWYPCHPMSTPDTGPGFWNCYTSPSDGNSYLMLITRGPQGPYANTAEDCGTALLESWEVGSTHHLLVDLARSDTWGHYNWDVWIPYTTPVRLRIWCASGDCGRVELLHETAAVTDVNWTTYAIDLSPTLSACDHLVLEAWYDHFPKYFGNVLVDNIRTLSSAQQEEIAPNVTLPNVITPNGDGQNDALVLEGLDHPGLKVFNRWGNLVYESPSYRNDWTAKEMSEGVYYYVVDAREAGSFNSPLHILR